MQYGVAQSRAHAHMEFRHVIHLVILPNINYFRGAIEQEVRDGTAKEKERDRFICRRARKISDPRTLEQGKR